MSIQVIVGSFILIPLVGFLLSLFVPERSETVLSRIAFITSALELIGSIGFIGYWLLMGSPEINIPEFVLFKSSGYEFLVDFYFDKITAVYLFVGAFLTFLITRYSRYYLHRESGYKRFFNTILFFYLGYSLTIFSGNFETLFIGWEILGLSSFLLVAFYRERYLPVRNAVKVFTIYRIGDVGILLAMWASHHLWHENISFMKLGNYNLVHEQLQSHSAIGLFISLMILVAAAAKSAQLPFSSWLPRAMEGPTPSSAIFYGSLSVHFGVFLLLRTYPFWEHQFVVRLIIGLVGASTAIVGFTIARVQSTIKSQIAYASISQIGIMFIEIALGWHALALIHFAGNAFLRTYQLLVSPAVVSYLIRNQFYHFTGREKTFEDFLPKRFQYSLYVLSLKEWNLDLLLNRMVFAPIKQIGKKLNLLSIRNLLFYFIPTYLFGILLRLQEDILPIQLLEWLPEIIATLGLLMVLKSFSERNNPYLAWVLILLNHAWLALAISFNGHFDWLHIVLYLSGFFPAGILGLICLFQLKQRAPEYFNLNQYYGHVADFPKLSFVFLLASMGLMGFPITPSFIGEDLVFSHIHSDQFLLATVNALSFVLSGIALIRIYARLFLGIHARLVRETPYKSS